MVSEITRHDVHAFLERGAQLVDVLGRNEYDDSHLPGAINIPLGKLAEEAPRQLDPSKPTITYCYDSLCDMSPRAAWRLEGLGFVDVYDYAASKVDWIGAGLPFEGTRSRQPHLASIVDSVPTCMIDQTTADARSRLGDAAVCIVVNDRRVVLGLIRADGLTGGADVPVADVMDEAPKTFRPHVSAAEMADQLESSSQPWVLVTNLDGTLVGITDPDRVRQAAKQSRSDAA